MTLRDDMSDVGGRSGGQQVVGALGPEPIGRTEPLIHVPDVRRTGMRRRECSHHVHDRVRFHGGDRFSNRYPVEPGQHNPVCAQVLEQTELARAGRRGRDAVTSRDELRHQPPSQDP
jgi:hypothetical protein